jgi:hypothetical protein
MTCFAKSEPPKGGFVPFVAAVSAKRPFGTTAGAVFEKAQLL